MTAFSHPPKHLVREYLQRRARDTTPPPTPEQIRRELGWTALLPALLPKLARARSQA